MNCALAPWSWSRLRCLEILYSAYASRINGVKAATAVLRGARSPEALAAAAAEVKSTAAQLTPLASGIRYVPLSLPFSWSSYVPRTLGLRRSFGGDRCRPVLTRGKSSGPRCFAGPRREGGGRSLKRVVASLSDLSDVDDVPEIARRLLCIPLALPPFAEARRPSPRENATAAP